MKKKAIIFDELFKQLGLTKRRKRAFKPSVELLPKEKRICLMLEDVSFFSEWISGEDSDIGIYRAIDDGRVVGGLFPLRFFNGDFPVYGRYS
jgi:hypothetical protein